MQYCEEVSGNGLVYGQGKIGVGNYKSGVCGKSIPTKVYQLWLDMLRRCYSPQKQKIAYSYVGCTVSENFKNFQFFAEWCNNQVGFGLKGYELDKDLLIKGNKLYSENTCVFLPRKLNCLIKLPIKIRSLPPCVYKDGNTYRVIIRVGDRKKSFGRYLSVEEAFYVYKTFKESVIKETAERWKDQIDPRAYNALISYEVEITD